MRMFGYITFFEFFYGNNHFIKMKKKNKNKIK